MYTIHAYFYISVLIRYAWLGIKDEPGCETAKQMIRHHALNNTG